MKYLKKIYLSMFGILNFYRLCRKLSVEAVALALNNTSMSKSAQKVVLWMPSHD